MITEAIQATELSRMEKQKDVYLRINNNMLQKGLLLILHNSQRHTKNYIRILLTY